MKLQPLEHNAIMVVEKTVPIECQVPQQQAQLSDVLLLLDQRA